MRKIRVAQKFWVPISVYAAVGLVIGCGGGGGGGSATGGSSTGTTSTTSTTATTTGATGGAVYFLSDKDGPFSIYKIEADGTGLATVSSDPDAFGPCVSWDGTEVAFENWNLYADVWRMDYNGANPTQIFANSADGRNPCLSPDGLSVIFSMSSGGQPQLFRTDLSGGNLTQLTSETDGVSWGRYSPDGTKIVYATAGGAVDVRIMNADGTGAQNLATGAAEQDMPTFSPDGTRVVYMQNFGTALSPVYQIMRVNAGGGGTVRMTSSMEDDRSPCYSQDGLSILFTRPAGGAIEIFRMPASGGAPGQVTTFGALIFQLSAGS